MLQEELIDSSPLSDNQRMDKLEKTNSSLRKQNLDLLEQLQVGHIFARPYLNLEHVVVH